jgi:predicted DNA-binding transcriptional regulator YafY
VKKSGDTLQRQWHLLRFLPRYPQKITASDLQVRLANEGYKTTKRSVERDLNALSEIFPIVVDDREKPYGWSWEKHAPILDVPGLTGPQALAFMLLQRFLSPLLPTAVLGEISPYFKAAEKQLAAQPRRRGMPSWTDKIRVVQPSQTLRPPDIKPDIQLVVHEGLLLNRQIKIAYHKRGAKGPVEYTVHPLGLVQRGPVFYLVCTLFHYQDVLLLALHRVLSAVLMDEEAIRPKDFELDSYVYSGALDFGAGKKVRLEALFVEPAAEHLHETPLSEDQAITPAGDGWVKVAATVNDTPQLAWWLLAFGEQIEVLKPASLRKDMATSAAAMARNYRKRRT